jgi:hypothetical protein
VEKVHNVLEKNFDYSLRDVIEFSKELIWLGINPSLVP